MYQCVWTDGHRVRTLVEEFGLNGHGTLSTRAKLTLGFFFALLNKTATSGQRSHRPLLKGYLASSFMAAAAAAFRFCEALGLRSSESGLLRTLVSLSDGTIDVVPFGVEWEPEGFDKRSSITKTHKYIKYS